MPPSGGTWGHIWGHLFRKWGHISKRTRARPGGRTARPWGHMPGPWGHIGRSVGAHVRPAGQRTEIKNSKTCGRINLANRSVSGVIAQSFNLPPTHGHQSGHRPGLQSSTRQRAGHRGHWITAQGGQWPPASHRPGLQHGTRAKGRAPWAPATVPGQQRQQRQQGHQVSSEAARPFNLGAHFGRFLLVLLPLSFF